MIGNLLSKDNFAAAAFALAILGAVRYLTGKNAGV